MKSAAAYKRPEAIYLHSHSQSTTGLWITTAPFIRIGLRESLVAKGEAVFAVLSSSGNRLPHPKLDEWDQIFAPMLKLAGVRSVKAFEKNTLCCGLTLDERHLIIVPDRQLKPGHGYEPMADRTIELACDCSPAEAGAALEQGFSRCCGDSSEVDELS